MVFVFRVDSSSKIGHGHLMRCIHLAKKLKKFGAIYFFCKSLSGNASDRIIEQGFHIEWLDDCEDQINDAIQCQNKITTLFFDDSVILIVDHYELDIIWEKRIYSSVEKIVVIDDLADRKHFCQLLIDQSLVNTRSMYAPLIEVPFDFIGHEHIILHEKFEKEIYHNNKDKKIILLSMGGADPNNASLSILKTLNGLVNYKVFLKEIHIQLILGSGYCYHQQLDAFLDTTLLSIEKLVDVTNIEKLLADCSVAILSCGTMVLESCSMGVPTLGVAIVDNQEATGKFLQQQNAIFFINNAEQSSLKQIVNYLECLIFNIELSNKMSLNAKKLISSGASEKIARKILCLR